MNENLNLIEILKNCPKGTKLYNTIHGNIIFQGINQDSIYPIETSGGNYYADGKYFRNKGECVLFPSKDQRDWSKFTSTIPDKALVWCWNDNCIAARSLGFYDAKNNSIFTLYGERDTGKIPLDFIYHIELYKGEYPEWAKEALIKLED